MFVEAYKANGGNATQAALTAGYAGNERALASAGSRMLRFANVAAAIAANQEKALRPLIATRERRQQLWSEMLEDGKRKDETRLRASELLGKSQGDFIEVHKVDLNITLEELVLESMKRGKK